MDEQPVRLALLRKAFQSDWEGAAPTAPSSNGCAQTDPLLRAAVRLPASVLCVIGVQRVFTGFLSSRVAQAMLQRSCSTVFLQAQRVVAAQEEGQQQRGGSATRALPDDSQHHAGAVICSRLAPACHRGGRDLAYPSHIIVCPCE